jgi:hypothetical protein
MRSIIIRVLKEAGFPVSNLANIKPRKFQSEISGALTPELVEKIQKEVLTELQKYLYPEMDEITLLRQEKERLLEEKKELEFQIRSGWSC